MVELSSATVKNIADAIIPATLTLDDRLALIDLLGRCLAADRVAAAESA